jgi:hypothetical protein
MARQEFYCQCKLRRLLRHDRKREPASWVEQRVVGGAFYEVMVSWIPADIAKKGNKVRLKEFGPDEWSEGWEVMSVGDKRAGDRVEVAVPDWKHQRSQSDV